MIKQCLISIRGVQEGAFVLVTDHDALESLQAALTVAALPPQNSASIGIYTPWHSWKSTGVATAVL